MSANDLPPDMGAIAGPLLIAHFLQWGLFGALSVQVYLYYLGLPNDPLYRKALVYGVYAAELVQTILYADKGFQEFAAGFGNILALEEIGLLWFAAPVLTAIVSFVVQIFYAYRIKVFTQSYIIPPLVALLALCQLGGGIAEGVLAQQISLFSSNVSVQEINIATSVWNGCSAACDLLIVTSMTYSLSKRKSAWKPTQRMMQRLTRLIIGTGTLTAAIAIINLILFVLPGDHPTYYQTTTSIIGKIYSNTMMVTLNSRINLSKRESGSTDYSTSSNSEMRRRLDSSHGDNITVTQEQWTTPPVSQAHNLNNGKGAADTNSVHAV
jgi:hypothetical protein